MATMNGIEFAGPGWSVPPELWPTAITRGRPRWSETQEDRGVTPEQLCEAIEGCKFALRTAEGDGSEKYQVNAPYTAALRKRLAELEAEYQLRYGLKPDGE